MLPSSFFSSAAASAGAAAPPAAAPAGAAAPAEPTLVRSSLMSLPSRACKIGMCKLLNMTLRFSICRSKTVGYLPWRRWKSRWAQLPEPWRRSGESGACRPVVSKRHDQPVFPMQKFSSPIFHNVPQNSTSSRQLRVAQSVSHNTNSRSKDNTYGDLDAIIGKDEGRVRASELGSRHGGRWGR